MLTPESVTGGERKLVGSIMVMTAEKIEQVREIIEADIYYKSDVVSPSAALIRLFRHEAFFSNSGTRTRLSLHRCCKV
jgi:uncharacterized protein